MVELTTLTIAGVWLVGSFVLALLLGNFLQFCETGDLALDEAMGLWEAARNERTRRAEPSGLLWADRGDAGAWPGRRGAITGPFLELEDAPFGATLEVAYGSTIRLV